MAVRLHFQIDAQSGVPVYRQLMDQMKYYVASGALVAGDQLPSIRELAQSLTLNPATIVKVYNELAHEQVIELRQGKGAFVAAQANLLSARDRDRALRRIARQLAVEAAQMGMDLDQVLRIVEEEVDAVQENQEASQGLVRLPAVNARR